MCGFLSVNCACDLSVIIRTAIIDKNGTSIGCGGAIVADSDPDSEFDEMLLKAKALLYTLSGKNPEDSLKIDGARPLDPLVYNHTNDTNTSNEDNANDNIDKNHETLDSTSRNTQLGDDHYLLETMYDL